MACVCTMKMNEYDKIKSLGSGKYGHSHEINKEKNPGGVSKL